MSSYPPIAHAADLAGLDPQDWFAALEDVVEEHGSYNFLGKSHTAGFIEAGRNLLVTFESAEAVVATRHPAEPVGFAHIPTDGWSHLGVFSKENSWFRHEKVYAYFDRLIDDGFFDSFENILFFGADGGGYAACAYSVAAPGARVLAIRPQATLDPQVTGFDQRYRAHRRQNFQGRYGFAPAMIDAAQEVSIAFDPLQRLDAVHAALFTKPHVHALRCTAMGQKLDKGLEALGISADLRRAAMAGRLDALTFASLMRARRTNAAYLRRMLTWTESAKKPRLAATVCAHAIRSGFIPVFEDKLKELEGQGHKPFRPLTIRAAE
ncbi:MAG: hypothetical protein AAFP98_10030 [Pseudomonadota bacterium]